MVYSVTLEGMIGKTITIEDRSFQIIRIVQVSVIDPVWFECVEIDTTEKEVTCV